MLVVLYPIAFGYTWTQIVKNTHDNDWTLTQELSPYYGKFYDLPASSYSGRWCFVAASPSFTSLSVADQYQRAATFFDVRIRPQLARFYYADEPFRSDFIRQSSEAMVKQWPAGDGRELAYRDLFSVHPSFMLGRVARDAALYGAAFLIAGMIPVLIVAAAVRWVIRGFRREPSEPPALS